MIEEYLFERMNEVAQFRRMVDNEDADIVKVTEKKRTL